MRGIVVVVAALLLATTNTHAEPVARKNPRTALWLSLGTTAAGIGLVAWAIDVGSRPQSYYPNQPTSASLPLELTLGGAGGAALIVGPSLGRAYGRASLWNLGTGLRVAGLGVFGAVLAGVEASQSARPAANGGSIAAIFIGGLVGGGIYVAGATYEIATTPRDVERRNRELDAHVTITALRTHDRGLVPGVALAGRF